MCEKRPSTGSCRAHSIPAQTPLTSTVTLRLAHLSQALLAHLSLLQSSDPLKHLPQLALSIHLLMDIRGIFTFEILPKNEKRKEKAWYENCLWTRCMQKQMAQDYTITHRLTRRAPVKFLLHQPSSLFGLSVVLLALHSSSCVFCSLGSTWYGQVLIFFSNFSFANRYMGACHF